MRLTRLVHASDPLPLLTNRSHGRRFPRRVPAPRSTSRAARSSHLRGLLQPVQDEWPEVAVRRRANQRTQMLQHYAGLGGIVVDDSGRPGSDGEAGEDRGRWHDPARGVDHGETGAVSRASAAVSVPSRRQPRRSRSSR